MKPLNKKFITHKNVYINNRLNSESEKKNMNLDGPQQKKRYYMSLLTMNGKQYQSN